MNKCTGYGGCLYKQDGRCIYNIAPIKVQLSRACYDDMRQAEIEAELDYLDDIDY